MFKKLISLIGFGEASSNDDTTNQQVDINELVKQIRAKETREDIPQGKQIYSISYDQYAISLDREFTGCYRISIFLGSHKVYGVSISKEELTDEELGTIFQQVFSFLGDNPSVKTLPKSDLFKAHFFGNP